MVEGGYHLRKKYPNPKPHMKVTSVLMMTKRWQEGDRIEEINLGTPTPGLIVPLYQSYMKLHIGDRWYVIHCHVSAYVKLSLLSYWPIAAIITTIHYTINRQASKVHLIMMSSLD